MLKTQNRLVMIWLFIFAFVVAFLVVFGGYVRLTRSGLSIVEWNPVSGILPPMGDLAWKVEFEKYQESPEFQLVNFNMNLDEYKEIFYIEWAHRLIARLAGLLYAIPICYFLIKRIIPWKEFGVYFVMGLMFVSQAFMGWFMVASGLLDRPSVSHIRLSIHLLFALGLLAISLWVALGHRYGFPATRRKVNWSAFSKITLLGIGFLLVQITYGGFVAGLKAGHLSNTWPTMFGKWIPSNLFSPIIKLVENPATVLFTHRWFAFATLIFIVGMFIWGKLNGQPREVLRSLMWIIGVIVIQITLGVLVTLLNVELSLALLHQTAAVVLFGLAIQFLYHSRARDWKGV